MKEFSNPMLMSLVRQDLLNAVANKDAYCDPKFGDIFHRIVLATDDVVTRFSCQGHAMLNVTDKLTGEDLEIEIGTELKSNYNINYAFNNFPYVYFLCTPKGKLLIEQMFFRAVELTKELGYPTYIYDLTTSHYSGDDCEPYEETFRMDFKGVHLNTLSSLVENPNDFFVYMFIKVAEEILLKSN